MSLASPRDRLRPAAESGPAQVALHSAAMQGWPSPDPASGLAARDHSPSLPDPVVPGGPGAAVARVTLGGEMMNELQTAWDGEVRPCRIALRAAGEDGSGRFP